MDILFQKIVQTTKIKRSELPEIKIQEETERDMLERHCRELFDLIIKNFEDHIVAAANRGSTNALLCLYNVTAVYRNVVPIHDLLLPSERVQNKLIEYDLIGLLTRLQNKFAPFKISIKPLNELFDNNINRPDINAISIEWDIETPELVSNLNISEL